MLYLNLDIMVILFKDFGFRRNVTSFTWGEGRGLLSMALKSFLFEIFLL